MIEMGIAAVGIASIGTFFKEAMEFATDFELSQAKLAQVMINTMGASNEQIQSIVELTNTYEALGVQSQDAQMAGAQELGTYLTKTKTLQNLIPVMNDMLSQQYGVNASQESAVVIATMLGKVMNGQVGALSRYGYSFDEAQEKILKFGSEEERAAILADVVNESVGGMNQTLLKTDAGKMFALGNALDDVKLKVGKLANDFKMKLIDAALPLVKKLSDALLVTANIVFPAVGLAVNVLGSIVKNFGFVTLAAFAVWKGTEFLAFIQMSGGLTLAIASITGATQLMTAAKIKDIAETIYLNALYAKDFIVSLGKATIELGRQAIQFGINTAVKIADAVATWSAAAALLEMSFAEFALNMALQSSAVQWIKSTALKIADTVATTAAGVAKGALAVATGIATGAMVLFNAAMAANPIATVIILIASFIAGVTALVKWLGKSKEEQNNLSESTENLATAQDGLSDSLEDNEKALESYTASATNMFERINTESALSVKEMTINLLKNQETVRKWSENLESLSRRGVDEGLLQSLRDAGPESAGLVDKMVRSNDVALIGLGKVYAQGGEVAANALKKSLGASGTTNAGSDMVNNIADSVKKNKSLNTASAQLIDDAKKTATQQVPKSDFKQIGEQIVDGAISGVNSKANLLNESIEKLMKGTVKTANAALDIHSPSKVFAGIAENTIQGFINKVSDMKTVVNKTVDNVFGNLGSEADIGVNFKSNALNGANATNAIASSVSSITNNYYPNVTIDARSIKDFSDVVKLFQNLPQAQLIYGGVR